MSDFFVHQSAYVDDGAVVGAARRSGTSATSCPAPRSARNCSLGQKVFVAGHCAIGNNVKIQNNVSIYEGVTLEDDVFCGPSMVFTNVRTPRSAFPRNNRRRLCGHRASSAAPASARTPRSFAA